ncbi:MAG: NAD-dependent SIR2 family protein deacetylase [Candidatus Pseudothioglobus sp.]|jgi:NAD-dependent SIR2 family protein deacetylase
MTMLKPLVDFIDAHQRLLVLTGAGCSASSGIPTYRDHAGQWQRNTPIQHADFVRFDASRKRYWARSLAGWPAVSQAQPNAAHITLASMEGRGQIPLLVTQNVDRLHQRAGHQQVIDLHGRLDQVMCLACDARSSRDVMQQRLLTLNSIDVPTTTRLAPDGDADVEEQLTQTLQIPTCEACGGTLKPDVVFFGGAVPKNTVESIYSALTQVDGMLVVGSSLTVFSGFRFCREAHKIGLPIAAINQGKTRADDLFSLKIEADCVSTLNELAQLDQY